MTTEVQVPIVKDSLPTACAKIILQQIQSIEADVSACFVTIALTRKSFPEATKTKTDDEIQIEMINPLVMRFKNNVQLLMEAAERNHVNAAELSFKGIDLPPSSEPPLKARAFYMELSLGDQEFRIPMTAIQYEGQWYLLEILMTNGIFGND
jgi:hypothetical protein